MAPVDVTTQWREDWSSVSVLNHSIVTDPTIREPGFDLRRHTWSLLNWTGQGPCHAYLHKWGFAQSPSCDCGQRQTMNHTVDTCPLTKFESALKLLHEAPYWSNPLLLIFDTSVFWHSLLSARAP